MHVPDKPFFLSRTKDGYVYVFSDGRRVPAVEGVNEITPEGLLRPG